MTTTPNPTAERWRKKPVEIEAMQIGEYEACARSIVEHKAPRLIAAQEAALEVADA